MSIARRVIGGSGLVAVAGGGARLLSLVTVPVLTPLLGPEPYGIVALVGTAVALGSTLGLLGIDMAYARFYLQSDETRRPAVEQFCWKFACSGCVLVAALLFLGWFFWGKDWQEYHRGIALYSSVAVLASCAIVMMTVRVRLLGNYGRVALSMFLGSLAAAVVSIGAALFWRADFWALLVGSLAASFVTLLVLGIPTGFLRFRASGLSHLTKRDIVYMGLAGAVTAPMYWVISSADRWVMARYIEPAEIGIFTIAASIAMVGLMLNSALTLTWFPEASRLYGEDGDAVLPHLGRLLGRLTTGLAVVWLAVAAAGGDALRLLAAPAFHGGATYIPWLAGGVFFYGLSSLANTGLFLQGRMKYSAFVWMTVAPLSILLNFVLVPLYGPLGAAIVQCASFGACALGILIFSQSILPIEVPAARTLCVLSIAVAAGIFLSPPWHQSPIVSLAFKFPVGLLFAVLLFRIAAPDWIGRVWHDGRCRLRDSKLR